MAELIDLQDEEENNEPQEATAEQEPQPEAPEVPEKYKGKSFEDIVRMHQEAEQLIGRHSQEVGELRGVVDSFIKQQLEPKAPQAKDDEEIDFYVDPEKAVEKAIANHPKIKEAEQFTSMTRAKLAKQELDSKHPDAGSILQDAEFQSWVRSSPVKQKLFQQAHQDYDVDAADELFSTWKERKQIAANTAQVETQARKQSVRQASTGNARASAGGDSRKVYRRADIIKLMKEDPARYEAMQDDIMAAYASGRVK